MQNEEQKAEQPTEAGMAQNPLLGEVPKVTGEVYISYSVRCPQCGKDYDDCYTREWFDKTMGSDFPTDGGWNQEFDAKCEGCGQEFIVDGFVH